MESAIPLAERMRPKNLDEYIGQQHLVGKNAPLKKAIDSGFIPSLILWGPPGVGKTTLANIIAFSLDRAFYSLSAINSGVKDIRDVLDKVKNQGLFGGRNAILFIDEIHRFSKSQQDSLLGAVEKGTVTLIGATTENPSFEVISALLSRCQVYVLQHHEKDDLISLLERSVTKINSNSSHSIKLLESEALLKFSGGDARRLLNLLEIAISNLTNGTFEITNKFVEDLVKINPLIYDKTGEQHYDIASAFIKSIRGSDPNAAVYWLARMIEGGEDPKFIARRLIISASEDIGNANPTALILANNCFQAVSAVGMPESRITLSQCAVYLASSPKSNASYVAINSAQQICSEQGNLPVPLHLRNAPTKLMNELGYGKDYVYSHNESHENSETFSTQEFLPDHLSGQVIYQPGSNQRESKIREFLRKMWGNKYRY